MFRCMFMRSSIEVYWWEQRAVNFPGSFG